MRKIGPLAIRQSLRLESSTVNSLFLATLAIVMMLNITVHAEPLTMPVDKRISIESVLPDDGNGFRYVLEYYVAAPIEAVWQFKTKFDSELLMTNDDLIGHRLVRSAGDSVVTENRYAYAPGLTFLWRTTKIPGEYKLTFELMNPGACRHDYHHGSIKLSPAGDHTRITQTAYFNFRGASLWVRYPWYGGMKSTLTKLAKWEQKLAREYWREYLAALRTK